MATAKLISAAIGTESARGYGGGRRVVGMSAWDSLQRCGIAGAVPTAIDAPMTTEADEAVAARIGDASVLGFTAGTLNNGTSVCGNLEPSGTVDEHSHGVRSSRANQKMMTAQDDPAGKQAQVSRKGSAR